MDLITVIYLADVVDNVKVLFGFGGAAILLFSIFMGAFILTEDCSGIKYAIASVIVSSIMLLFSVVIPSKQAIYIMAGAKVVQDISKDPRTQNTLDKIYKIIDSKLDEQLNKGEKK